MDKKIYRITEEYENVSFKILLSEEQLKVFQFLIGRGYGFDIEEETDKIIEL